MIHLEREYHLCQSCNRFGRLKKILSPVKTGSNYNQFIMPVDVDYKQRLKKKTRFRTIGSRLY
jgi:hypothetical protein